MTGRSGHSRRSGQASPSGQTFAPHRSRHADTTPITGSLGLVEAQDPERELIERALGHPVAATARAAWGFTNRTDMVTLAGGQRAVVQRYRHREDAGYRLQVMQGLSGPAIEDPEALGGNVYTVFDNESDGQSTLYSSSRAVTISLDPATGTATLIKSVNQPEGLTAAATG